MSLFAAPRRFAVADACNVDNRLVTGN